jgi:hypothetical protein
MGSQYGCCLTTAIQAGMTETKADDPYDQRISKRNVRIVG